MNIITYGNTKGQGNYQGGYQSADEYQPEECNRRTVKKALKKQEATRTTECVKPTVLFNFFGLRVVQQDVSIGQFITLVMLSIILVRVMHK